MGVNTMRKNIKGQMAPIGLVMIFVSVILLTALMPAMQEQIRGINTTSSPTLGIIVDLVPLLLWLGLIISIFIYVTPFRPGG